MCCGSPMGHTTNSSCAVPTTLNQLGHKLVGMSILIPQRYVYSQSYIHSLETSATIRNLHNTLLSIPFSFLLDQLLEQRTCAEVSRATSVSITPDQDFKNVAKYSIFFIHSGKQNRGRCLHHSIPVLTQLLCSFSRASFSARSTIML